MPTPSTTSTPYSTPPTPVPLYNLLPTSNLADIYAFDPYQLRAEGQIPSGPNGAQIASQAVQSDPGYAAYGSDWSTLLNTLQSLPKGNVSAQYADYTAGINPSADAGGGQVIPQSILSQLGPLEGKTRVSSPIGSPAQGTNTTNNQIADIVSPLTAPGSTGLMAQVQSQYGQGAPTSTLATMVLPTIAQQFGLDPNSQQAQTYADAYVTYALQSSQRDQTRETYQDQSHDLFGSILGDIGEIGSTLIIGGPEAFVSGAFPLASADIISGVTSGTPALNAATAAATPSITGAAATGGIGGISDLGLFNAAGDILNAGQGVSGVLQGVQTGNPLAIGQGVVGLGEAGTGLNTALSTNQPITSNVAAGPSGGATMDGDFSDILGQIGTAAGDFYNQNVQPVTPSASGDNSTSAFAPGTNLSGVSGGGVPGITPVGGSSFAPGTNLAGVSGGASSGGGSFGNLISNPSFGSLTDFLTKNAGAIVPGAALAYNAIQGQQPLQGQNALNSTATQLGQQGQQLQTYLQNGTLPPGLQAGLQQAADAAKATIRSQYASRGASGSSAEQQDLANVDQTVQAQGAQMALQLLQQGVQETGLASSLYQQLMQTQLTQDQQLNQLFGAFGSALGGGGGTNSITLKMP
jgi:hypothetical protein